MSPGKSGIFFNQGNVHKNENERTDLKRYESCNERDLTNLGIQNGVGV